MASKKGIAITAAIIAGIVGASSLVWLIPQSGVLDVPRTDSEIISDIYGRNNDLASSIESDFARWNNGTLGAQQLLGTVEDGIVSTQQMQKDLQKRQPAQEWQRSYGLYVRALDTFEEYLMEIETVVVEDDEQAPHQGVDSLRMQWQKLVDDSVNAMPAAN